MFLNKYGNPVALERYNDDEELLNAAIVLTTSYFDHRLIPAGWKGKIYSSEGILAKFVTYMQPDLKGRVSLCPLIENVPTKVSLWPDHRVTITLVNYSYLDPEGAMFLIKDGERRILVTGYMSEIFSSFANGSPFRKAVVNEIDTLYIDDLCFRCALPAELAALHPTELQLRVFVFIVRPRNLIGLFGSPIPTYIRDFCAL